jgi:hypothetical protein
MEIITTKFAILLEKNSRSITKGDKAINAPINIKIDGSAGGTIFKNFINTISKAHPIKNTVNPIVITEDIV